MRYLLVLGFACDAYCRTPRARVFLDNQLIDEFDIKHNTKSIDDQFIKYDSGRHILEPISAAKKLNLYLKNLPDLKFYEINIHPSIDSTKLQIEIQNNINNYTNGFISKNTTLMLKVCNFFPLDDRLLTKFEQFKNKKKKNLKYAWYRKDDKNFIFDLAVNGIKWQGENGQIFPTNKIFFLKNCSIGGNGTFTCELIKKYGILGVKLSKPCRFDFEQNRVQYFMHKYTEYENQGNTY